MTAMLLLASLSFSIAENKAPELPDLEAYVELPVAAAKKKEVQKKLNEYAKKVTAGDGFAGENLRGHLLKIQRLLMETQEFGGNYTIKIDGKGGEGIKTVVITITEGGWMDDATQGQRYQYAVSLFKDEIDLVSARAWMKPWADRLDGFRKYVKTNKVEWGSKAVKQK